MAQAVARVKGKSPDVPVPAGRNEFKAGIAAAAPGRGEAGQHRHCRHSGNPPLLRRRVTDVPDAAVEWFMEQDGNDAEMARELARSEATAQRDGYVIRWADLWVCQVIEPVPDGRLIESAEYVVLDGTPDADPRAREIEQRLLRKAALCGDGEPASAERDECGRILRRYAGCHIAWELCSVCQLFEPDGITLIARSDCWVPLDPATDPRARGIAACLLLEAGV